MSFRISPVAPPGSLLKGAVREPRAKPKAGKDSKYLTLIRRCPCLACDADPAGEAAHLRMSGNGKPIPGMGAKPADRYALPLCHRCHMEQHAKGERPFWETLGLDPMAICDRLSRAEGIEAMRGVILKAKEARK